MPTWLGSPIQLPEPQGASHWVEHSKQTTNSNLQYAFDYHPIPTMENTFFNLVCLNSILMDSSIPTEVEPLTDLKFSAASFNLSKGVEIEERTVCWLANLVWGSQPPLKVTGREIKRKERPLTTLFSFGKHIIFIKLQVTNNRYCCSNIS